MKKPSRVSTGAVYLKCKTAEICFCLLLSLYNLPILILHIEGFYKVGQRYFFGQVLAPFIELIGQAYRLGIWYVNSVVFRKQYGHCPLIPIWRRYLFGFAELAYLFINPSGGFSHRVIYKTTSRQFIAFLDGFDKS